MHQFRNCIVFTNILRNTEKQLHVAFGNVILKPARPNNTKKGCIIMNKTQLIQVVADKTELSRKDAEAAVNAVFEAIVEAMKAGDKVQLIGFGAFGTKEVAAKKYVDRFGGGREVTKPAYKKPTFVAGKALKDALN